MPRKKFIVKNKAIMKQAIDEFKELFVWWNDYTRDVNSNAIDQLDKVGFDSRDFGFVVAYMHNPKTKEEFHKALNEEMENIQKDFKGTVDRFLNSYEKTDFTSLKTDTLEDCRKSIMIAKLSQIPGNINEKRRDYKEERYKTTEAKIAYDNYTSYMSMILMNVNDVIWESTGINMNSLLEMDMDGIVESPVVDDLREITNDSTSTLAYDKGESKYFEVQTPAYFYFYSDINASANGKETSDKITPEIEERYGACKADNSLVIEAFGSRFLNDDSYSTRITKGIDLAKTKSIFIDGKPLIKLADAPSVDDEFNDKAKINNLLADAVKDGKAIDICQTYIENGKLQSRIVPLKFNWTEDMVKYHQEQKVIQEHSWFRRTFFDWGPFKIKRDPNIMDEIYGDKFKQNEANMESRHKDILKYRNGEFLNELNVYRKEHKLDELQPGKMIESKYKDVQEDKKLDKLISNSKRLVEVKELDEELNTGFYRSDSEIDSLTNEKEQDLEV